MSLKHVLSVVALTALAAVKWPIIFQYEIIRKLLGNIVMVNEIIP